MKKLKNGSHFVNIDCTETFQITNPPPKFGVSGFPSVDGNGISASAIMKKLKNGSHFINIDRMEKFQITDPPQSLCLQFSECWQKWNISISHYEKLKNGSHFINIDHTEKIQITDPPLKVWVSSFLSVDGNGISASAIMKKYKNGSHFVNIDRMEKFQITNPPPKVWVSGFPSIDRNRISVSAIMKKLKNGCPITHPRLHFNIYAWFTSHLCVALHFLIFDIIHSK